MYSCSSSNRERKHTHKSLLSKRERGSFESFSHFFFFFKLESEKGRVQRIIISRALFGPYIQKGNTHFAWSSSCPSRRGRLRRLPRDSTRRRAGRTLRIITKKKTNDEEMMKTKVRIKEKYRTNRRASSPWNRTWNSPKWRALKAVGRRWERFCPFYP